MSATTLDILLIEDNPGDARLVREMFEAIGSLGGRLGGEMRSSGDSSDRAQETGGHEPVTPDVVRAERLSAGLDELDDDGVDIVLLDLNLPDSRGLDTLDAVLENTPAVPVVVLTGMEDRELGLEALDRGAQEYLVKDEINADLLVRTVFHAIQRERYERELERQHERLSTLYDISAVVQDIGGSLIDHSTLEEIESAVCERLADSGVFRHAWIGEIDRSSGTVEQRTDVTEEGFFEGVTVSIDEDDPGPVASAALGEGIQVVQADEVRRHEDWDDHATEFGYRSFAAIPIAYEDALYGILVVYSGRPDAFEAEERGIMERLGNVVGHAINAVERKTTLMTDATIELSLLLPDFVEPVSGQTSGSDSEIEFLTTIPAGDGSYLQYANVEGFSQEGIVAVLEQLPGFEDVRQIETSGDRRLVEIQYADTPVVSTLAAHGGHVRSTTLVDGDYHVTVELPADADVRSFVSSVRESYPDVDLVAQRSVDASSSDVTRFPSRDASLTDKQRAALEAAYFAGYFDQPRASTGEEIADSLDITASTFHQHLQAGLRKLLAAEFESG